MKADWLSQVLCCSLLSSSDKYAFSSQSFSNNETDNPGYVVKMRLFKMESSLEQLLLFPYNSLRYLREPSESLNGCEHSAQDSIISYPSLKYKRRWHKNDTSGQHYSTVKYGANTTGPLKVNRTLFLE